MATKILHLKSLTGGNVPTTGSIDAGELAVNLVDRKIYSKDGGGAVVRLDGAYVDTTAPSNPTEGDIWYDTANNLLKAYNGTSFASAGYATLETLEDTTITSVAEGEVLSYDATAGKWINRTLAEADIQSSSALGTAATTDATDYATAAQGATADTALQDITAESIGDLSDVDITTAAPTAGQVLAWNSTNSEFEPTDVSTIAPTEVNDLSAAVTWANVPDANITASSVEQHISEGTGVTITSGQIAIGQAVETTSDVTFNDAELTGTLKGPAVFTIDPSGHGDNTGEVVIAGDLTVQGTTTSVNSNEVNIGDAVILLNSDETGAPSQDAGIEVERGTSANVTFVWNESDDAWDLSDETLQNVKLDGGSF